MARVRLFDIVVIDAEVVEASASTSAHKLNGARVDAQATDELLVCISLTFNMLLPCQQEAREEAQPPPPHPRGRARPGQ